MSFNFGEGAGTEGHVSIHVSERVFQSSCDSKDMILRNVMHCASSTLRKDIDYPAMIIEVHCVVTSLPFLFFVNIYMA